MKARADEEHYALLTNILTEGTFGLTVKSYKVYKDISPNANLQNNMTPEELAFSVLSKSTAQRLHNGRDSQGVPELRRDVTEAGEVTGRARELIELATGQSIVSSQNAKDLKQFSSAKKKSQKQLSAPQQQNLL